MKNSTASPRRPSATIVSNHRRYRRGGAGVVREVRRLHIAPWAAATQRPPRASPTPRPRDRRCRFAASGPRSRLRCPRSRARSRTAACHRSVRAHAVVVEDGEVRPQLVAERGVGHPIHGPAGDEDHRRVPTIRSNAIVVPSFEVTVSMSDLLSCSRVPRKEDLLEPVGPRLRSRPGPDRRRRCGGRDPRGLRTR